MNKILKVVGFGFIVWLIPTIVTFFLSYINAFYFFDVITSVTIAVTVIVFTYLYFKDITTHFFREGVIIGVVAVVISFVLDVVLIFLGVSEVSLLEYAVTILPLYIIIPAITIGFGLYKDQMTENIQS